jgi:hypothetical protein
MEFYFECYGCGVESQSLEKEYTRLAVGQIWVCTACKERVLLEGAKKELRPLANGFILEETDF